MTTPTNNTHPFPHYFWEALITIHNHLFNTFTKNHLIDGPELEAKLAEWAYPDEMHQRP